MPNTLLAEEINYLTNRLAVVVRCMILAKLTEAGLIDPPKWLNDNTAYLVRIGSDAYGASLGDSASDIDIVGFALPRKEDAFPYSTNSHIVGFGEPPNPFQQWSRHHVRDGDKEYDLTVYSIVKFFHLAMTSSPNQVDGLFVPDRCIVHSTAVGKLVRDNRTLFLNKRLMHKLRGYAFSQMKKIADKTGSSNDKRQATIAQHGFDTKHGYHVARLCLQAEEALSEHTITLDRNSQILLSIRRGEWTLERLQEWFAAKELSLDALYATSTLRAVPDEEAIKDLLLRCLEMHYGDLSSAVKVVGREERLLHSIRDLMEKEGF